MVCCAGGLGNQMFQYAFYSYLRDKGFKICFNTSSRQLERHTGFELQRLFPSIRLRTKADKSCLVRRLKHALLSLCWNHSFPFVAKDNNTDICDRQFHETIFCGYWQQHGYIDAMRDQLLHDFQFLPLAGKNEATAKHIDRTHSVSIHIRRGDYMNPENIKMGTVCTPEYYRSAVEWIKSKVDRPEFIVFSDDMDWVKQHLILENALYVDWNRNKDSFRDMQLMSLCKHNIIANSTFSWWGAWLNRNPEKVVIMPSKWRYGWLDDHWLMPREWIRIEV
jgi:hypothetical protein